MDPSLLKWALFPNVNLYLFKLAIQKITSTVCKKGWHSQCGLQVQWFFLCSLSSELLTNRQLWVWPSLQHGTDLDFVHTYRSSLSKQEHHMVISFWTRSDRFDLSLESLASGQWPYSLPGFSGKMHRNPKGSTTSSAGPDLAMIGTDEVGNDFGGLTVVASTWPARLAQKARLGDSKMIRKIQQLAPLLEENIQHQALLLSPKVQWSDASGYNAVSIKVALQSRLYRFY